MKKLRYHPDKLIESINRLKKYFVYFWRTKKGYDQMRYDLGGQTHEEEAKQL